MDMGTKEILRDQAVARALGEIEAALRTFTYDADVRKDGSLYDALRDSGNRIRASWRPGIEG